jgi:cyanophycin synthetase
MASIALKEKSSKPAFKPPIQLIANDYLMGHNFYHTSSVLRFSVDFGSLADLNSSVAGPDFGKAFIKRFANLKSLMPNNGLQDDFIQQLSSKQGISFPELLLEAILAVENTINFSMHELHAITYAGIEKHSKHTNLIWSCSQARFSRASAEIALMGVLELLPETLYAPKSGAEKFTDALKKLQSEARKRRLSPSTAVLKLAAQKRGIPCESFGRQHIRLGHGNLQQQLYASMTSTTSTAAQKVCADKRLTNRRLKELRLPAPEQVRAHTLEEAYAAAEKLGYPVVIKPLQSKKDVGTSARLTTQKDIEYAFNHAQKTNPGAIVVESFYPGHEYRLLVVGGKFVAALERHPPAIVGDGKSTVEQLIDNLNADTWRDGFRLHKIKKDEEIHHHLKKAGVTMNDILKPNTKLVLRATAAISSGGLVIDVTDQVHADNRKVVERAANGIGLDVAGIDLLTTDISRSYREMGGVITELHARPNLCLHTWPKEGKRRNVAGKVLRLLYPKGLFGRIPVVAVAGDKGTGTTAKIVDMILRGAGGSNALALREHAFFNGVPAELTASQQRRAPRYLLRDPAISTLVSTVSPRQTAKRGLLFDECAVSIIMDKKLESDTPLFHIGLDILERATSHCFVVGSGNTVALNRIKELGGRRLILVADRLNDPILQAHLNQGHTGVTTMWLDGKIRIVILEGTQLMASFKSVRENQPRDGRTKARRFKNGTMYALAAAYGLGLSAGELKTAFNDAPPMIDDTV